MTLRFTPPEPSVETCELTRIKACILGTLRASELPGCYLRKPVSLLDIRQYCQALSEPEEFWVRGTGELLADGRITTLSRNGFLYLALRPDYQGDQGDETEPQPRTWQQIASPMAYEETERNKREWLRELEIAEFARNMPDDQI